MEEPADFLNEQLVQNDTGRRWVAELSHRWMSTALLCHLLKIELKIKIILIKINS